MSFLRRLFSADYRAAVAAEASGDLELAAERYALAGYHDAAARMHMARAERAISHREEIDALRDALHWAPEDGELCVPVKRALGKALLARAEAEGTATARDRDRVREAAKLLEAAEQWRAAGDAWESIGADGEAARAYGRGGLVEKLEEVLARTDDKASRKRTLRDAFANYETFIRAGDRDAAAAELGVCVEGSERKAEYRRLLDELESKLITGGHVVLRSRRGPPVIVAARSPVLIGRDSLCDLPLRAGGVSRRHTEISLVPPGPGGERFVLRDSGSRNGTRIGGLRVSGAVPLIDEGEFALGDTYVVSYRAQSEPPQLLLRVARGLDQGMMLIACSEDHAVNLQTGAELPLTIRFENGRPLVESAPIDEEMTLNGESAAHGRTQLIHGDQLVVHGLEIEVQ